MTQTLTKPYPFPAYLIDPLTRSIEPVALTGQPDPLSEIYALLGCQRITAVQLSDTDAVYVDDEGMLHGPVHQLFGLRGVFGALAGRGLVVGVDRNGADDRPTLAIEAIKSRLVFIQRLAHERWLMTAADDPRNGRLLPLDKIVIELAGRA